MLFHRRFQQIPLLLRQINVRPSRVHPFLGCLCGRHRRAVDHLDDPARQQHLGWSLEGFRIVQQIVRDEAQPVRRFQLVCGCHMKFGR